MLSQFKTNGVEGLQVRGWDSAQYPADLIEYTDELISAGDNVDQQDALDLRELYRDFGYDVRDIMPSKYWRVDTYQMELFSIKSLSTVINPAQFELTA
jgi:hypothetical protein